MTLTGTIHLKGFGTGAWALDASDGTTYELYNPPTELQQEDLKVTIEGNIRDDVMTLAMIGPVLEVRSFKLQ